MFSCCCIGVKKRTHDLTVRVASFCVSGTLSDRGPPHALLLNRMMRLEDGYQSYGAEAVRKVVLVRC